MDGACLPGRPALRYLKIVAFGRKATLLKA